jgi:DNA end-binding protein Ku
MAEQLIASLSADFEPEKFRDEYRDRVLELIERKAAGEELTPAPEAPEPVAAPDLMAALEASLAAVRADSDDTPPAPPAKAPRKRAAKDGDGAPAKSKAKTAR